MSFKQAKELVDKIELTELTLKHTMEDIHKSSQDFNSALQYQERILQLLPKAQKKINFLSVMIALNIGFIVGIVIGKYIV
ncbi:MAG: tetratricopeptide repeat protein [Campylobacterota bacterium]|nr:tetratricopeptide repeat protein [Campylobacterota bacterium]